MAHAGLRMIARDLVAPPGEGKRVVIADDALFDVAQDRRQLQRWCQGSMLIREIRDRARETLIPLGTSWLISIRSILQP